MSVRKILVLLVLLALSGCGIDSQVQSVTGIVTEKHHYPAHTKTRIYGNCSDISNDQNCVKNVKSYPELWEICIQNKACYYTNDVTWDNVTVGTTYTLDYPYDVHESPTDEWEV